MTRRLRLWGIGGAVLLGGSWLAVAGEPMKVVRAEGDAYVDITDYGKPVLRYHFATVPVPKGVTGQYAVARSDYIHPLTKDKPLVLRYRLWIQAGAAEDKALAEQWTDFNKPAPTETPKAEGNEIRTLKIARLLGVEVTSRRFKRPADFSLKTCLDGSFGIFSPGQLQTIKVRVTGWAARSLREQQWHPGQRIVQDGDGQVVATFDLSDTTEVKRWLLGFGRHAVVLKPTAFRDEVRSELCAGCAAYLGIGANLSLAPKSAKGCDHTCQSATLQEGG